MDQRQENIMIVLAPRFLNFFTNGFASAMALYPFVLIKESQMKDDPFLINHEKIHLKQQAELAVIPFYLLYLGEYYYARLFKKMSHYDAYMNISFEKEAYENDHNLEYLKNRKWWGMYRK
jgi:hypothetical protein